MAYSKIFDPDAPVSAAAGQNQRPLADRANSYVYTDQRLVLAINIALAVNRPLVLRGSPGCGKSSLAQDVARRLGWNYFEEVITSRTRAQDLLWKFDAVHRLADAQAGAWQRIPPLPDSGRPVDDTSRSDEPALARYVSPGVMWRAIAPDSASRFGGAPKSLTPAVNRRAVVLLDEIDKADPDVPNDLLVVLGALRFTVAETGTAVEADADSAPFVIITSNDERELPSAFLRRCVVMDMKIPEPGWLVQIAKRHYPSAQDALLDQVTRRFVEFRDAAKISQLRSPGTAEFLDAVRACTELEVTAGDTIFEDVTRATLWKHPTPPFASALGDALP